MNQQQFRLLKEGSVAGWNEHLEHLGEHTIESFFDGVFIENPPTTSIDLNGADLSGMDLNGVDLYKAQLGSSNLRGACLDNARLRGAWLKGADLTGCSVSGADFQGVDLDGAKLEGARCNKTYLWSANLSRTKCSCADFSGANLTKASFYDSDLTSAIFDDSNLNQAWLEAARVSKARFNRTNLIHARFDAANISESIFHNSNLSFASFIKTVWRGGRISNSLVYGISVWDTDLVDVEQCDLIITQDGQPRVTVDDLEVAQFLYLLLNRQKLRSFIETMTTKTVLVLGRFAPDRKHILDAIAASLRNHNLLPMIFDFDRSSTRDFTETIRILAGLSLFVIADITQPRSVPLELQATVPDFQIPFVPILQVGEEPFSMFADLEQKYDWVLGPLIYSNVAQLVDGFELAILDRAWAKHRELLRRRADRSGSLSIDEFLSKRT